MSTLKVTNIQATGETASRAVSGVAAVYCNVDQTSTQSITASVNVSSITDDGSGQTDISYTNNMSSADYAFTCGKGRTSGQNGGVIAHTNDTAPTASLIRLITFNESNLAADDARANVAIHGDLA